MDQKLLYNSIAVYVGFLPSDLVSELEISVLIHWKNKK